MELPKYILDKIKQQNEACFKAGKLEREIDNWCDKSGIDIWSQEYKETKGTLDDAVAPVSGNRIKQIVDKIWEYAIESEILWGDW